MSAPRLTKVQKAKIVASYMAGEPSEITAGRFGCDASYPAILTRRRLGAQSDLWKSLKQKRKAAQRRDAH